MHIGMNDITKLKEPAQGGIRFARGMPLALTILSISVCEYGTAGSASNENTGG